MFSVTLPLTLIERFASARERPKSGLEGGSLDFGSFTFTLSSARERVSVGPARIIPTHSL